jgi:hypothetical protein
MPHSLAMHALKMEIVPQSDGISILALYIIVECILNPKKKDK